MNELFLDKLSIIAGDKLLLQVLRAIFDERIEKEKPEIGEGQTNELLGEKYRAYESSKEILKKAFQDLEAYEVGKKPEITFRKEI